MNRETHSRDIVSRKRHTQQREQRPEGASQAWLSQSFPYTNLICQSCPYKSDLPSLRKGVVFVNGFELGRYWITPGRCVCNTRARMCACVCVCVCVCVCDCFSLCSCNGMCAPPIKNGHCYMHWSDCDEPTQVSLSLTHTLSLRHTLLCVTLFALSLCLLLTRTRRCLSDQTLYHIPTPVLKPAGNEVVLFEEKGGVGLRNLEQIKLLKLTAHP